MKVSIITVCYNSAKTIERTIKSVAKQGYEEIEYIIIDGGSTDGTLDIIDRYKDKISVLVSEQDGGIYDAMNKGIARATGDIIGFMNSDDWYADGAIVAITEAFKKTDADIVYGKTIISENGIFRDRKNDSLDDICFHMVFCHQAVFVKSNLLRNHPFDISYQIVADYEFFLTMYLQGKRFHQIDVIIAYFQAGGVSSNLFKAYMEFKKVSLRVCKGKVTDARYQGIIDYYRKSRILPIYSYIISRFRAGQGWKLRKHLEKQKIVLYGAGMIGKKLLSDMRDLGLNVIAFWDSNVSRYGTALEGVPIQAPCQKKQQQNSVIILLATIKENDAIAARLQSLGYENKKDFFIVEAWLGAVARGWMGRV